MTGSGRLLEVTNGGFVDAKREKPRLSVGQLWGNPTGGFGSARDSRVSDLAAGKLTPNSSDRIADVRGRQCPTQSSHSLAVT
jgi:hypothetical protein